MENKMSQNPRISYTVGYKGIVVGGHSDYHPEKVDVSCTRTIDFIEGESPEDTRKRLDAMKSVEELLVKSVEMTVMEKVNAIKEKLKKSY